MKKGNNTTIIEDPEAGLVVNDVISDNQESEKKKRQLKRKVVTRNIIIGILLVIIVLLFLKVFNDNDFLINRVINQEESEYVNANKDSKHIDIPVIIDTTVTKEQPYMNFCNPDTNADKFYLKYELHSRDDDSIIWESDMVEPGKKFSVDLYTLLSYESGNHYCYVKVRAFDMNTMDEKNGITNNVIITVR